jgi:hypothetical protein
MESVEQTMLLTEHSNNSLDTAASKRRKQNIGESRFAPKYLNKRELRILLEFFYGSVAIKYKHELKEMLILMSLPLVLYLSSSDCSVLFEYLML